MKWWVPGIPAPKGSARAVISRSTGKALLLASANGGNERAQKSWAAAVGWAARAAFAGRQPIAGPVRVSVVFRMPAPKRKVRALPTVWPDIDKLLRATLDAMTGIAWRDDALVVDVDRLRKRYADERGPGAEIEIEEITEEDPS